MTVEVLRLSPTPTKASTNGVFSVALPICLTITAAQTDQFPKLAIVALPHTLSHFPLPYRVLSKRS